MEDFIYVLLGLIWLVFSVMNAKKKKQTPAPNTLPKSELEEILEEFFPPKKSSPTAQPYVDEDETVLETIPADESFQALETTQPLGAFNAYSGEWVDEEDAVSVEELPGISALEAANAPNTTHHQWPVDAAHPFDLRKAVMYQAILQRPHF